MGRNKESYVVHMSPSEVMQEIVALGGKCLKASLCFQCPFKRECLPMFLYPKAVPTESLRLNRALDTLTDNAIFSGGELNSTT